jgi:4-amino-4-deoxy-L-arabinose transferase-like glycosyltransferase
MKKKAMTDDKRYVILLDIIFVTLIVVAGSVIVYYRLMIQYLPKHGPGFDSYALLSNALTLAGKSTYYEIGRPPFQPFLLSLFFRMGFVNELVAYLLDAFFYIAGATGLYLLMRQRFPALLSLAGASIFLSLPDMILNLTLGATDIIAISLSIWTIYFLVLGKNRDSRYLIAVFPLFIISFLTRYTAAVMLFPIVFYLLGQINLLRNMKAIGQSVLISLVVLSIDISYYWHITRGQALFQFLGPLGVATTVERTPAKVITGATPPTTFFITNLPKMMSVSKGGWLLVILFLIGTGAFIIRLLKKSLRPLYISASTVAVVLAVTFFLTFSRINFLVANTIIVGLFLIVIPYVVDLNQEQRLDMFVFIWFVTFLSYHSHQLVKETRYFITMTPQAAYLAVLGVALTTDWIKRFKPEMIYKTVTAVAAAGILAFTSFSAYQSYVSVKDIGGWGIPEAVNQACDWVRPQLRKNSVVYADYFVAVAWYLKRPVVAMPIFKDDRAYAHELGKYQPDFFISIWRGGEVANYKAIKHFQQVNVFVKQKNKKPPDKPRIFLVGQDIDHYLEDMLGFKYYIMRDKSPFPDDTARALGVTYLDEYRPSELSKYKVLLLYNFKWQNVEKAEDVVREYVKGGGTVVIDASGNAGKSVYDLNNSSFLGTSIVKRTLPEHAVFNMHDPTLSYHVDPSKFGPFIDEFKNPWQGSTYQELELPGVLPISDLVTADGKKVVVGVQKIGKGRVIWIGYNIIFHAFYYENKQETRMIQNIMRYAYKRP